MLLCRLQIVCAHELHPLIACVSPGPPGAAPLLPGNPVRGALAVQFQLREPAAVSLRVLDVRGRLVHEAFQNLPYAAGAHRWEWDGAGLASGVYILELHTPRDALTARAVVLR